MTLTDPSQPVSGTTSGSGLTPYGFRDYSSQFSNPAAQISAPLNDTDNARRLSVLMRKMPELGGDPATLVSLASAGTTDEQMLLQASQAISIADIHRTAQRMQADDPTWQRAQWGMMDPGKQQALQQAGYNPPPEPTPQKGWGIGILGHDIATVGGSGSPGLNPIEMVSGGISDLMDYGAQTAGSTMDAMSAPLQVVQHGFRTMSDMRDVKKAQGELSFFSPAEWANAWSDTSDGAHFFKAHYVSLATDRLAKDPFPADQLGDQWQSFGLGPAPSDTQRLDIAKSIGAGDSASDYARRLGLDETKNPVDWRSAIARWNLLSADPAVADAGRNILPNGHETFGRDMARGFGMNDFHSPLTQLFSGAMDAAFALTMDPVMMVGKASKVSTALRFGMRTAEGGEDLERAVQGGRALVAAREAGGDERAAVKAVFDQIGGNRITTLPQGPSKAVKATEEGPNVVTRALGKYARPATEATSYLETGFGPYYNRVRAFTAKAEQLTGLENPESEVFKRLMRDSPEAELTFPYLNEWRQAQTDGHLTPDKIFDFWSHTLGSDSITATAGLRDSKMALIPHLTTTQQASLQTKGLFTDIVHGIADLPNLRAASRAVDPTTGVFNPEDAHTASDLFIDKLVAPVGKFLTDLAEHGPYQRSFINFNGPNAPSEMRRFAAMGQIVGMTEPETRTWASRFIGTYNPGTGQIENNLGMMHATALNFMDRVNELGGISDTEFARKMVNRSMQQYGMDPDAVLQLGDVASRGGIWPVDVSAGMAIPSPMELIQATRQQSLTKTLLGGYTASPIEGAFSKVWKPLTLMHAGFIPRIAGEEMLNFMLRGTGMDGVRYGLAKWADQMEPALDGDQNFIELPNGHIQLKDKDAPDSIAAMPIKWMSSHLMDWQAPVTEEDVAKAAEAGKEIYPREAGPLYQAAGALDGFVNRAAAYYSGNMHTLATKIGIPDRTTMIAKLVPQDVLDDWHEAMSSPILRNAMADHANAAYWGHPDAVAAFDSVRMDLRQGGGRKLTVRVPLSTDGKNMIRVPLNDPDAVGFEGGAPKASLTQGYQDLYGNKAMRLSADDIAQEGMKAETWVTEHQAARVADPLRKLGYGTSGERAAGRFARRSDLDVLKAFKGDLDAHLMPDDRTFLGQVLKEQSTGDDPAAWAEAMDNTVTDEGRKALGDLKAVYDHPATRQEDLGLLINRHLRADHLSHDPAEVGREMTARMENAMHDPANQGEVAKLAAANYHNGIPVAHPIVGESRPVYVPMVEPKVVSQLRAMGLDPVQQGQLRQTLEQRLQEAGVRLDPYGGELDHIVGTITGGDDYRRGMHGTLLNGLGLKRDTTVVPAALWGSSDPRVADVVTKTLEEMNPGGKTMLGRASVAKSYVDQAGNDAFGLHTAPGVEGGKARSYMVDGPLYNNVQKLPEDHRLALYEVAAGNPTYPRQQIERATRIANGDYTLYEHGPGGVPVGAGGHATIEMFHDMGLPAGGWADANGQLTPQYWEHRDEIQDALKDTIAEWSHDIGEGESGRLDELAAMKATQRAFQTLEDARAVPSNWVSYQELLKLQRNVPRNAAADALRMSARDITEGGGVGPHHEAWSALTGAGLPPHGWVDEAGHLTPQYWENKQEFHDALFNQPWMRSQFRDAEAAAPVRVLSRQESYGIPQTQAIHELAQTMTADLRATLAPTEGGPLHSLLEPMTRGPVTVTDPQGVVHAMPSALTPDHLIPADHSLLPQNVYGPERIIRHHGRWEEASNNWFENWVQPALSAVSRNPQYAKAYADSARQLRGLYGNNWIPADVRAEWEKLATEKLGLDTPAKQQEFLRFAGHLPPSVRDTSQSVDNVNQVLGNALGIKFSTRATRAEAVAEGGVQARAAAAAGARGAGDTVTLARAQDLLNVEAHAFTYPGGHAVRSAIQDAGLPVNGWVDDAGRFTDQYTQYRDELRTALGQAQAKYRTAGADVEKNAVMDFQNALNTKERLEPGMIPTAGAPTPLQEHLAGSVPGLNLDEVRTLQRYLDHSDVLERHVQEVASQAAMQKTLPFIHDPAVRSQLQSYVGTLMPFQFAQEQFLKRWAKTFLDDPSAARKLLLLHDGMRNTGMVQKDPFTGEDTFVWPGSQQINQLMAKVNPLWPGAGTFRGLAYAPLSGSTSMIMPSMSEPVAPNLGPAAGLAMHGIAHMFPEFASLDNALASDKANPDRSLAEYVVPAHLSRIYQALAGNVDKGELAGVQKNVIAMLAAHGQGPPVGGTEHDQQTYLDRVRDLSRSEVLLRGLFGLAGPPGGASIDYHDALADDYKQMMADGMDPQDAFSLFVAKHQGDAPPDVVFPAYTVFATKSTGGSPLPQTQAAVDYVNQNMNLVQEFPHAAGWLMPQSDSSDPRVRQAYQQQLQTGLRTQRTPREFMDQLTFAEAADPYFAAEEKHNAIVNALPKGSAALKNENDDWNIRSQTYQAQHPIFTKMLQDPVAKQRREDTRTELTAMLAGPDAPVTAQSQTLAKLLRGWQTLQDNLDALKWGSNTKAKQAQRQQLPQNFMAWASAVVGEHPEVTSFYNSVFKPDLPAIQVN